MRPFVLFAVLFGVAALARPVEAQPSSYARNAKDTVRFKEVTNSEIRMTLPQGEVAMPIEHNATIAVVFLPGDTARAWYEALKVTVTTPMGPAAPETDSLLKQPFILRFDSRGRTTLIKAPILPASFEGVSDLSHQFDDFFVRLPAEALKVGQAWTDTLTRGDSAAEKRMLSTTIAQYRVARDTTVAGEAAVVILMTQKGTISTAAPVPGQDMRSRTELSGGDEGWVIFAPKSGRMLGRERKGEFKGSTHVSGAMGEMSVQQTMAYTHRIDIVK